MVHQTIKKFQTTTIIFLGNDEKNLGNNKKNSIIKSMVIVDQTTEILWDLPKTFSKNDRKVSKYDNWKFSIIEFNDKKIGDWKLSIPMISLLQNVGAVH